MKTLKKILLIPLFAVLCMFSRIDSATAIDYPFSVTTSSIAVDGTFQFYLSAQGTFYVDCGDGGTLSGTGVTGGTIEKTNTTEYFYKCTYSTTGTKTIRFGGVATQYNTGTQTAAIRFNITDNTYCANAERITSISGDLSAVFPYISTASGKQPKFYKTFYAATNLTSIPETLFSHITGTVTRMFDQTFGRTGLTSIPGNLFSFGGNNVSGQEFMFNATFAYTNITTIPGNLFVHVTGVARSLFNSVFFCCYSLTSIPENLFSHITSVARDLYANVFRECTGLTSLPTHLFAHITSTAINMFRQAFRDCTGLTGYIPPTLFAGLIANGSPYSTSDVGMMYEMFYNTGSLATTCPGDTIQYTTGYESYWYGHVSCGTPVNLTWYDGDTTISGPSACAVGGVFLPPTPPARTGYVFNGWKIKKEKCGIDQLDTSIGGIDRGYTKLKTGIGYQQSNYGGLTAKSGKWAVEFDYGAVWGIANCNSTSGTANTVGTPTLASSGTKCWCQVTGFTASGNSYTSGPQCTTAESSLWVFITDTGVGNASLCADGCPMWCTYHVMNTDDCRTAIFGAVGQ